MPPRSEINSAGLWNGVVQLRQEQQPIALPSLAAALLRHATILMAQTLAASGWLLHIEDRMFDRNQFFAILAGATGGAIAIASMELFSASTAFPLVAIPFATSIVTVLGSPKAEPAQPRALVGGHLVSTLVGLLIVKMCGPVAWAAALAVGLAMVAMHLSKTFHPPAGIDPLVVVVKHQRRNGACSFAIRSSGPSQFLGWPSLLSAVTS